MRLFSALDLIIQEIDTAVRTLLPPKNRYQHRLIPGQNLPDPMLTSGEKKHVAGLMRINHAGEVCAQALYQSQALVAANPLIKKQFQTAAQEETDHLAWCEQRLQELNARPSLFNPLWYAGAFTLGSIAGLINDNISLSFVAETELQVSAHLQQHLNNLPANDLKTHAILSQMNQDEAHHAELAYQAGAIKLPWLVRQLMRHASKVMTKTSYYL